MSLGAGEARERCCEVCSDRPCCSGALCSLSVGVPDPPSNVHLSVASSSSVQVTFWEPLSVNSAVVTKYKGKDWGPCAVAEHTVTAGTRGVQAGCNGVLPLCTPCQHAGGCKRAKPLLSCGTALSHYGMAGPPARGCLHPLKPDIYASGRTPPIRHH